MRGTAEALSFCANAGGKDFAEIDPDYRALRDGKKSDVKEQQPKQVVLMSVHEEDGGDAGEADGSANGANQQQRLEAKDVTQRNFNESIRKDAQALDFDLQLS